MRRRQHLAADAAEILAAGAFDQQWYEAQAGRRFASAVDACRDYLQNGRRAGRSPHPLCEPGVVDPSSRKAAIDPLLAQLRGRRTAEVRHPGLPAFADPNGLRLTPGSDGPVPLTWAASPPVWAAFRTAAIDAAAETHRVRELRTTVLPTETEPVVLTAAALPPVPAAEDGRPLVSVIMPAWNRADVIGRAVASVQAQTLGSWELLVVDDGSDDDTAVVADALAANDPRIHVVRASHGGVCRARNLALAQAQGRFVAFLDTDNTWRAGFLAAAAGVLVERDVPWAHAILTMPSDTGLRYRALEGDREHLLVANYIDLNVLVATRDAIASVGGFDESMRRAVDYDLILRLSELAPPTLVPAVGADYTADATDAYRISVVEPVAWNYAVALRHLVRLDPDASRIAGRVSVVVPVRSRARDVVALVSELRRAGDDVEVVVVVTGRDEAFARALRVAALGSADVHVVYWPEDVGWAGAIELGAARATGEYLVAWRAEATPTDGWWLPLRETLAAGVAVAQPLLVRPDGLIAAAGAVFVGPDPCPSPLLDGLPVEDAVGLGPSGAVPAAYGGVFAVRADVFAAAGGVDPIYGLHHAEVDLSWRLGDVGETHVVPASRVTLGAPGPHGFTGDPSASVRVLRQRWQAPAGSRAVWARVGFTVEGHRVAALPTRKGSTAEDGVSPVVRPVRTGALRWALDVDGAPDDGTDSWTFAQALAAQLRAVGQHVHVDRTEARTGAHRDFDDVALTLRGADPVPARPGATTLLWVLPGAASAHEPVGEPEAAGYDGVLAADPAWAEDAAARWGITITTLATGPDAASTLVDLARDLHDARLAAG